jgi:predicted phage terminase large subunit-like protein
MPTQELEINRIAAHLSLKVFTEQLGYNNAPFQLEWYDKLENSFSPLKIHPNRLKLLLQFWPRGHGKTSCNINYLSWLIGNYPDIHINLISKTAAQAESILLALMTRFESDERFIEIFGELKPKQPKKWTTQELIVNRTEISKNPTIQACGLIGPITGRRADLNVCDDIIDEENVRSALQLEKALTWHDKVLAPTLYPWGGEIVTGTRWHYADLYAEFIKRKPQAVDIKKAIIEESTQKVLWPNYWTYQKLVEKRGEVGSIIFDCQYQNDPTSMEGSLLKAKWLHSWDETNTDSLGISNYKQPQFDNMRHYFGVDPSLGEGDYFGIAVLAYDPVKRVGYLREVWAEHLDLPTIIKTKFAQMVQLYKPLKIYMESNFWQKLLNKLPELQGYPITPINTVKNKEERFIPLSSHFEAKRVLVNPLLLNHSEFWTQWVQFPRGQHDDAIDCVELVVSKIVGSGPASNPSFVLY